MAKITKDEVIHISELSRIGIPEGEIAKFQSDLDQILEYVDQLKQVDVVDTTPLAQVTGLTNIVSDDNVAPCRINSKLLLANVPRLKGGSIVVPAILEES